MKADDFRQDDMNRREFLSSNAKNAAGMAAGMVGLAGGVASASSNDCVRVAVIGVRGQGKLLASSLATFSDVDIATLCDVDESVLAIAAKSLEPIQTRVPKFERDFRRVLDDPLIDAVVIATPDHWHAIQMILACQAGKDVYVEKPISHSILEGERMLEAARKYERVVQSGIQQRSGAHFQSAIEFVRSGKLGDVHLAKAWTAHRRKPIGTKKNEPIPAGVDYDMWLGPAAERPFNRNRFHYNWRWFWDYGIGELGNWGVHMLDIARWGLGVELPTSVRAGGGKYHFRDDQQTPDTLLADFSYADKTISWEHRLWSVHGLEGRSAAAAFYGDRGTLVVDRGGWKVYDLSQSVTSNSSEQTGTHLRNFIDCMKSRELPNADIETGHVSSVMCQLGNIAFRLGRQIEFDPESRTFGNDFEANRLLERDYRSKWALPMV